MKKATNFFSVIIPTLNEAGYLPKLLDSLRLQTINSFEVIVVDGHSDDNTVKLAEEYARKLPFLKIINSHKRNLPFQRNLGAKDACGEYFVFFDADVIAPPEFLEGIHYAIIRKKPTFLTTWVETKSKESSDQFIMALFNLGAELSKVIGRPIAHGPDTIIRRDVFFKVGGFRENIKMAEDHDFSLRVHKAGYELTILKEPRLIMSLRRFRSEGTINALGKFAQAQIYMFLKGPITQNIIDYQMGGHIHKKKAKKVRFDLIDSYIKGMEKLEDKFNKLLTE